MKTKCTKIFKDVIDIINKIIFVTNEIKLDINYKIRVQL